MALERAQAQADRLVADAEKRLKSWSLFDRSAKYEDAVDYYKQAASQYKVAQQWDLAAKFYAESAELAAKHLDRQEHHIADCFVQAAKVLKNTNTEQSLSFYARAIDLEVEQGKFSTAARHSKEVAEMQERLENFDEAVEAYQRAADCYKAEDASTSALACLVKVAELSAMRQEDDEKAIKLFEAATKLTLENQKLHWMCKDYLFKASLCQLRLAAKNGDMSSVLEALDSYCDLYPAFESASEFKFLRELAVAFQEDKLQDFNSVLGKRNQIFKLDPFTVDLLYPVKEALKNGVAGNNSGSSVDPEIKVVGEGLEAQPLLD